MDLFFASIHCIFLFSLTVINLLIWSHDISVSIKMARSKTQKILINFVFNFMNLNMKHGAWFYCSNKGAEVSSYGMYTNLQYLSSLIYFSYQATTKAGQHFICNSSSDLSNEKKLYLLINLSKSTRGGL